MTPTLRQLIEGATPGPWQATPEPMDGRHHVQAILTVAPTFTASESWPYHPLIAQTLCGRGHAPIAVAHCNAQLIARMASPEVALAVLEALEECRAPLDGYIHGDNEITVPTLHNMLNAVDRALSRLNGQAQPSPAP